MKRKNFNNSKKPRRGGSETRPYNTVHGQAVELLAHGLKPVKSPMPVWGQWLCWIVVMSVLTFLYLSRVSLRGDLPGNLSLFTYDLLVVLVFGGAALAAWGAIEASIPAGEAKGKWKTWLAFLLYSVAFLLFVLFLPWGPENYPNHSLFSSCFVVVLLVGLVCWIGLGFFIRHNAPLNPRRVALWAGISSFLVGLGVVTLHCGSHNLAHVCLEHFLPVLAYSWLISWVGYRWLCSWKRKPL